MTITMNQISPGTGLNLNGEIFLVVEQKHVKPGKGGAFVRAKLKNIKTDAVLEQTFKSGDKLEEVSLEEHPLQYLYRAGDVFYFMNHETYEQIEMAVEKVGESAAFLLENLEVKGIVHESKVLKIELPIFIEAELVEAEPGVKGDSSKAGTKPAKIETGAVIQVPLFINQGDCIKIDTRSGAYVERIQK